VTNAAVAYLRAPEELTLDPGAVPSGLGIAAVVVDDDASQRAGLGQALQLIAAGHADTLFVQRLGAAAGSLGELVRLLEWLEEAGAALVAADVGLNTGKRSGRRLVAVLHEVERWEREPDSARPPPRAAGAGRRCA